MNKLELIEDENLLEIFSKEGYNTYHDGDGLHKLAIVCENFQSLSKICDENVTISMQCGVFNPQICDAKLKDIFENISLEKHNYEYVNEKIKVYDMRVSDDALIYHILTSIGIISIRQSDIYKVAVLNPYYDLNNQFAVTIKTFNSDVLHIKFNSKI